jgi:hypothetical protein
VATTNFQVDVNVDSAAVMADIQHLMNTTDAPGLRKFLEDTADPYLQTRVRDRFSGEGDDASGQWLPLKPATESIRAALGYGPAHPINVRTGDMQDYLTNSRADVATLGQGAVLTFPPKGADALTAQKIETAQVGKNWPPTPARPVVALSVTDEAAIVMDLADYITQGLVARLLP